MGVGLDRSAPGRIRTCDLLLPRRYRGFSDAGPIAFFAIGVGFRALPHNRIKPLTTTLGCYRGDGFVALHKAAVPPESHQ